MKSKIEWKSFFISLAIPLAVGGLSALLTREGMKDFQNAAQPPLSPPQWLFPVVWTILYLLMGAAAYLVSRSPAPERTKREAMTLYWIQLAFNFLWSIVFFNLGWYLFAFLWLLILWGLVLAMYLRFRAISPTAGWMILPYLLWLTFAAYLNFGVWRLNG